jgi:hypothetical protein
VDGCQPRLHGRVLVRGVVVQNHMHRKEFGYFSVDGAQELQELFVAVLVHARPEKDLVSTSRAANCVVVPCLL